MKYKGKITAVPSCKEYIQLMKAYEQKKLVWLKTNHYTGPVQVISITTLPEYHDLRVEFTIESVPGRYEGDTP